jgi:predicted RNase H-like HicB family nuclease
MLSKYIRAAMTRAQYQVLPENDAIYGEIPGFEGVSAQGDTLEDCRHDLTEALEEWIFFRASRRLPGPAIDGVQMPSRDVD